MRLHNTLASAAALVLTAGLTAQGTYTTFGAGCSGSAGNVCASNNANATTLRGLTQNSNIFSLEVKASTTLRIITGFELFTQAIGSANVTFKTEILDADATGKPGKVIKSGSMTITPKLGWYRTNFTTPLILAANKKIFLSYKSVASKMRFPIASAGTRGIHYWHSATGTSWSGPWTTQNWAWKVICGGGSATTLSNTGVPTINSSFTVDLSGGRANANAIFALGISNSTWGAIKLPLDLAPLNAKGCSIYVSPDFVFFIKTDASGGHKFQLTIPNNSNLKGVKFYNQYVVDDPAANGFGATFSNGGAATIG